MATIAVDTLHLARKLKESGISEKQAEAITEVIREANEVAEVASKTDLREMELRMDVKLAEMKSELVRWVVGAGFLQTALIAALLLKLIK
jgi:hypothetical protein